jgi:hypothetical protein
MGVVIEINMYKIPRGSKMNLINFSLICDRFTSETVS